MVSDMNNATDLTDDIHDKNWDNHDELKQKEIIIQRENDIEAELKEVCRQFEPAQTDLLSGMIEIGEVILKNTSGIGSNFKLAECDLNVMTEATIRRFFSHVLSVLGYHFGQLVPDDRELIWSCVSKLLDDPDVGQSWQQKLSKCLDHQDGHYSLVRGGRLLWEEVARLLHIKEWETNTTARIYYQTALAQDLIYVMESIENEKWTIV